MPPPPAIAPSATQQLLHALAERPDASAAELADAAGIGRSTASKLLATLFAQGRVLRRSSGQQGGRRIPDRWTLPTITATTRETTTVAPALPATPTPQAADVDQPRPAPGRLGAGQLQDLVEACLAQRPDQPLSATAVAKTLDRSAGAVANALQVLASQARVVLVQTRPRRYVVAASNPPAATS
jgi:IclR helix-turn-helix domain